MTQYKTEFLRILAPVLGCGFGDLFKLHQHRRLKRLIQIGCVCLAVLVVVGVYFVYNRIIKEEQGRLLAEFELLTQLEQELLAKQELLALLVQEQPPEQVPMTQAERITHALNVAEELILAGNNVLASVVLMELYSSYTSLDNLVLFEIERLLFQSTHVPKFTPFAILIHNECVTSAVFDREGSLYAATKDGTVTVWNNHNGEMLGNFITDSPVPVMVLDSGILYAVTQSQNVLLLDINAGRVRERFSFFNGTDDLSGYEAEDIMLYDEKLYICERDHQKGYYSIRKIDLSTKESSLMFQSLDTIGDTFHYCAFDMINNRILITELQNSRKFLTIYHPEYDTFNRIDLPDDIVHVIYSDSMNCFVAIYGLSDSTDFIVFKYDFNGSIIDQFYYDGADGTFFPQHFRESAISLDGKYIAISDSYGNILILDIINMKVSNFIETDHSVDFLGFIDDKHLFISFESEDQNPVITGYDDTSDEIFSLLGSGSQRMLLDSTGGIICLIDTHGNIALLNTGHSLNETASSLTPDDHENVVEIDTPDFTQLVDMAIIQTAGRKLTQDERQLLMLSDGR